MPAIRRFSDPPPASEINSAQSVKVRKKKATKKKKLQDLSAYKVGLRCKVKGYECKGTIRFVGDHVTKEQPRVLVELDAAVGKNDGTVEGHRYGECQPKHGILVQPKNVEVVKARGSFKVGSNSVSSTRTTVGGMMGSLSSFAMPTSTPNSDVEDEEA